MLWSLEVSDAFCARSHQLNFHLNSTKEMDGIITEFKLEISNYMDSLMHWVVPPGKWLPWGLALWFLLAEYPFLFLAYDHSAAIPPAQGLTPNLLVAARRRESVMVVWWGGLYCPSWESPSAPRVLPATAILPLSEGDEIFMMPSRVSQTN